MSCIHCGATSKNFVEEMCGEPAPDLNLNPRQDPSVWRLRQHLTSDLIRVEHPPAPLPPHQKKRPSVSHNNYARYNAVLTHSWRTLTVNMKIKYNEKSNYQTDVSEMTKSKTMIDGYFKLANNPRKVKHRDELRDFLQKKGFTEKEFEQRCKDWYVPDGETNCPLVSSMCPKCGTVQRLFYKNYEEAAVEAYQGVKTNNSILAWLETIIKPVEKELARLQSIYLKEKARKKEVAEEKKRKAEIEELEKKLAELKKPDIDNAKTANYSKQSNLKSQIKEMPKNPFSEPDIADAPPLPSLKKEKSRKSPPKPFEKKSKKKR